MSDPSKPKRKQVRSTGAKFVPVHTERSVAIYPIQEHELKTISICNGQVALWCSIGSLAIGVTLNCIWGMVTSDNAVTAAGKAFVAVAILAAVLSFCVAKYYHRERNSEMKKIMDETGV